MQQTYAIIKAMQSYNAMSMLRMHTMSHGLPSPQTFKTNRPLHVPLSVRKHVDTLQGHRCRGFEWMSAGECK